jgi:hypothetical protein
MDTEPWDCVVVVERESTSMNDLVEISDDVLEPGTIGEPHLPQSMETRRQEVGGTRKPDQDRSSETKTQGAREPSGPGRPHGMKTITSFQNGWDTIKVIGDIWPVDIPSLKSAVVGAFLRRPVRLAIDLSEVSACGSEGIRWILETRQRIARCGGELKVAVLPRWPTDRLIEFNLTE